MSIQATIIFGIVFAWIILALTNLYINSGIAKAKRGYGWRAKDQVERLKQIRDWLFYLFVAGLWIALTTLWVIEAGTPDPIPKPPTEVTVS